MKLLFENDGGGHISSLINVLIVAAVLMFVYKSMAKGAGSGFNNTLILGVAAAAVVLAVLKIFLARRKKK